VFFEFFGGFDAGNEFQAAHHAIHHFGARLKPFDDCSNEAGPFANVETQNESEEAEVEPIKRRAPAFVISMRQNRAQTKEMGNVTAGTGSVWTEKRKVLRTKRDSLFAEYTKRPQEYQLALEIKTIDDEIADCNEKEQEGNERVKVRRQRTLVSSWQNEHRKI
jgi:hypothetical protein